MMTSDKFLQICRDEVAYYVNHYEGAEVQDLKAEEVYVVWFCKTLQNFKALLSTPVADGMYYELTYNGDKKQLYFDAYKKYENKCIDLSKEV